MRYRLNLLASLRRDRSGVALMEFGLALPIFIAMCLTGAEMTNYITTKMRVSQLALQLADNAARIGSGSRLSAKKITEVDINDLFVGANLQSGGLKLLTNSRVVLSSLEPVANPNPSPKKFTIRWQRCYGNRGYVSGSGFGQTYAAGQTNLTGIGPTDRPQATAEDDNATMFVEIYYVYKPLIGLGTRAPTADFTEIASMAVRDRRDLTDDSKLPNGSNNPNPTHPNGVYKVNGVTPSTC